MTLPQDDKELTHFLRNHHPKPPAAAPDLEDRILGTIASGAQSHFPRTKKPFGKRQLRSWLVPSAIAASLLAAMVGYRSFTPASKPSPSEIAALEEFIETSWHGPINDTTEEKPFWVEVDNDGRVN
jgi:hypothetical protein